MVTKIRRVKKFTGYKLTEEDVQKIKTLCAMGLTAQQIEPFFAIGQGYINRIMRGDIYEEVSMGPYVAKLVTWVHEPGNDPCAPAKKNPLLTVVK